MKQIEFIGKPSGDGESFCWEVSPEEYKRATGRDPRDSDFMLLDFDENMEFIRSSEICRLYPGAIFGDSYDMLVDIKIECKEA